MVFDHTLLSTEFRFFWRVTALQSAESPGFERWINSGVLHLPVLWISLRQGLLGVNREQQKAFRHCMAKKFRLTIPSFLTENGRGKGAEIINDVWRRREIKTEDVRWMLWKAVKIVKYLTELPGRAVGSPPPDQEVLRTRSGKSGAGGWRTVSWWPS